MSVVAIIQARMSSKRLPGKVLFNLAGRPVLWHVINRLKAVKKIDKIIVATSLSKSDEKIVAFCKNLGVMIFRGSLDDVLDRYYQAARFYNASHIVRVTADCPLIDPTAINKVISCCISNSYDWCSISGEFPDGLDCQVFTFKTLEEAWTNACLSYEREHVGPYIEINNRNKFNIGEIEIFKDLGGYRLTLDEPEDFKLLTKVFKKLYQNDKLIKIDNVIKFLKLNPDIMKINSNITRNQGLIDSMDKQK